MDNKRKVNVGDKVVNKEKLYIAGFYEFPVRKRTIFTIKKFDEKGVIIVTRDIYSGLEWPLPWETFDKYFESYKELVKEPEFDFKLGEIVVRKRTGADFIICEISDERDVVSSRCYQNGKSVGVNYTLSKSAFLKEFEKKVDKEHTEETKLKSIPNSRIEEIMNGSKITVSTVGKTTICHCKLPNGFEMVESSSCLNPDDYNEEIGKEICIKKLTERVYELEAYRISENHYQNKMVAYKALEGSGSCNEGE